MRTFVAQKIINPYAKYKIDLTHWAIFTKLLETNIVANSLLGPINKDWINLSLELSDSSNSLCCRGLMLKKATSDPEIIPDKISKPTKSIPRNTSFSNSSVKRESSKMKYDSDGGSKCF